MFLFYFFVFIFGLIIGSFVNCLVLRLYDGESLMTRSHCPKCKKKIAWYDNIPLLSYIILLGRCRGCKKKISFEYPAVELALGTLFLAVFLKNIPPDFFYLTNFDFYKTGLILARDWFFCASMTALFIYDLRWYQLPDIITIPSAIILLIFNIFIGISIWNLALAVVVGILFFLIQFIVSKGKWIGDGDIRFGAIIGAGLGWPQVMEAILISYFIGSFVGLSLIVFKKKSFGSKLPLGVFLAVGTIITLLFGESIMRYYLGQFS